MKTTILTISVLLLMGCASTRSVMDNTATIIVLEGKECAEEPVKEEAEDSGEEAKKEESVKCVGGVRFTTSGPAKVTAKIGGNEYTYDGQKQGWISKLVGYFMGGLLGRR